MSTRRATTIEHCIARLLEREWTKQELATELQVSQRTVKRYLRRIEAAGMELSVHEQPLDQNLRHYRLLRR